MEQTNHTATPADASSSASKPSPQPMFCAAAAFAAGILLATYCAPASGLWYVLFLLLCLYAAYCCIFRTPSALVVALAAIAVLGLLQTQLDLRAQPQSPDLSRFAEDQVFVVGHVVRSGLLRQSAAFGRGAATAQQRTQTLDVVSEKIVLLDEASTALPLEMGIRVNVHSGALESASEDESPELASTDLANRVPVFAYGDRVQFLTRLREPHNYGDPGAMDYRGYLLSNGIVALASVREDRMQRLPGFSGSALGLWRARARRSLVDHMLAFSRIRHTGPLGRLFTMDEQEAGVLAAMIIGEQSLIQRNTRADFQRTGTYHILVVSGMNVAILAFVIFWLARRLRAGEVSATLITILLSLLYAYMTDLGSPIVRAALMLSLYLGARLLYRDRFSLNSIGAAALLMLLAAPQTLFEASFQLTFLSVVVLSAIIQPVLERTVAPYQSALSVLSMTGFDSTLPPRLAQFRIDMRMVSARISRLYTLRWLNLLRSKKRDADLLQSRLSDWIVTTVLRVALSIVSLIVVTTIIQAALALPMVIYFHRMALMGLPSNMVIVPLTAVLMPVGIAATLLSYVSHSLAAIPIAATALTLHAITGTVAHLGGIRFADLRLAMPSAFAMSFSALAFVFAMAAVRSHRRLMPAAGVAAIFIAALVLALPPPPNVHPGVLEVTAIDVGQGDSILIVSPTGRTLLIDGGGPVGGSHSDNFDVGEDVVSAYLWSRRISRLDAIALTHGHSDHLAGLHSVLANFHPRELWIGRNPLNASYRDLLQEASDEHVTEIHRAAGEEFDFGGAQVRVLAPAADYNPGPQAKNDDSLVLEVSYGRNSALLSGDIERKAEHQVAMLAHHSDLLKVAHHGSATSTTPELLSAVQPRYAVISVGYHSIFGHPKRVVLDRLTAAHARIFRTDLQGAVTFYLDGRMVVPQQP